MCAAGFLIPLTFYVVEMVTSDKHPQVNPETNPPAPGVTHGSVGRSGCASEVAEKPT
jgi:hypothetical protein